VLLALPQAHAAPIQVTIDTTALSGTPAILAFDLIDGGAPANSVTVSGFATDGALGVSAAVGDVTGTLPGTVVLSDTSFFNEYAHWMTLGTSFTFVLDGTANFLGSTAVPDSFALFLLDAATGLPLMATGDPTGANALLQNNIGTSDPIATYTPSVTTAPAAETPPPTETTAAATAVPALGPMQLALTSMLIALAYLGVGRRSSSRRKQ
jgi:hypothetical protein